MVWEADGSLTGYMADVMSAVAAETGVAFNYSRGGNYMFNTDLGFSINVGPYAFDPGMDMVVGPPVSPVSPSPPPPRLPTHS